MGVNRWVFLLGLGALLSAARAELPIDLPRLDPPGHLEHGGRAIVELGTWDGWRQIREAARDASLTNQGLSLILG